MKKWWNRIRGGIGMGLVWGEAWALLCGLAGLITGAFLGVPLGAAIADYALLLAGLGLAGGTIFSTVLSLAEGGRRFEQLSLPRFVGWGALGGLLLGGAATAGIFGSGPTIFGGALVGVSTLLGAASAAATLVIARAADGPAVLEVAEGGKGVLPAGDKQQVGSLE